MVIPIQRIGIINALTVQDKIWVKEKHPFKVLFVLNIHWKMNRLGIQTIVNGYTEQIHIR
jgi:hypothetical protein